MDMVDARRLYGMNMYQYETADAYCRSHCFFDTQCKFKGIDAVVDVPNYVRK